MPGVDIIMINSSSKMIDIITNLLSPFQQGVTDLHLDFLDCSLNGEDHEV